jgi:hypothetical protein
MQVGVANTAEKDFDFHIAGARVATLDGMRTYWGSFILRGEGFGTWHEVILSTIAACGKRLVVNSAFNFRRGVLRVASSVTRRGPTVLGAPRDGNQTCEHIHVSTF